MVELMGKVVSLPQQNSIDMEIRENDKHYIKVRLADAGYEFAEDVINAEAEDDCPFGDVVKELATRLFNDESIKYELVDKPEIPDELLGEVAGEEFVEAALGKGNKGLTVYFEDFYVAAYYLYYNDRLLNNFYGSCEYEEYRERVDAGEDVDLFGFDF